MSGKPTHIVIRAGFYQRFGGKLQPLPVGTEISLSEDAGKRLVKRKIVKAVEVKDPELEPAPEPKETEEEPKPKRKYKKRKKN